ESTDEKTGEKMDNPAKKPYDDKTWQASKVTIGGFDLSQGLLNQLINQGQQKVPVDTSLLASIPTETSGKLKVSQDMFYLGKDPSSPQIGDARIGFTEVKPQQVSIGARQVRNTFEPYSVPGRSHTIEVLKTGTKSAETMFKEEVEANNLRTWILR